MAEKSIFQLDCDPGEHNRSVVTITDRPADEFEIFNVEADPADVERWRRVMGEFESVQAEMLAAWTAAQRVVTDREAAESAAATEVRESEWRAEAAQQLELDKTIGPREWCVARRQLTRGKTERIVHRNGCPSWHATASTDQLKTNLRLAEAVRYLLDNQVIEYAPDGGARPCGRCGREVREAWNLAVTVPMPSEPNPAGSWF